MARFINSSDNESQANCKAFMGLLQCDNNEV